MPEGERKEILMDVSTFYDSANHGIGGDNRNNRLELARSIFSDIAFSSLIDIGAGDGTFLEMMKAVHPDRKYVGLEISKHALELGKSKGLEIFHCDFNSEHFPFTDTSFDTCFMGELIEHVFSPDALLREARRVVKPGGWLFITTPNLSAWFNRISLVLGYQPVFTEVSTEVNVGHLVDLPGQPAGHIRLFTYRALVEIVERCGWRVHKSIGIGLNPAVHRYKIFVRILNFIFKSPYWSSGVGILARAE